MFGLIKNIYLVISYTVAFNSSSHAKSVSLSNKKRKIQSNLINLNPYKHSQ